MDLENIQFWAKTDDEGYPGISVYEHMKHVGYVAYNIAAQSPGILAEIGLEKEEVATLAALHDIGKISPGFQRKCKKWLEKYDLEKEASAYAWDTYESDHSIISQYSIQNILREKGCKKGSAGIWAMIAGIHHSRMHGNNVISSEGMSNDEWQLKRYEITQKIFNEFCAFPNKKIKLDNAYIPWLAGLISIADWIGSDETYFSSSRRTKDISSVAENALKAIGFIPAKIKPDLSFFDLFGFKEPNDLQIKAFQSVKEPGIYCLEAPMGMGKTEAALWISYNLMKDKIANGVYFALPTQATSNRIHLRMREFVDKITFSEANTRLIHGNSWLMEQINIPQLPVIVGDEEKIIRDWFASKKRGLLSPFGVGTIDQALMSVLAVKHFFVRKYALAGKIVILDEVHSYDIYTGTIIEKLCHDLVNLGATVLLLSATLTKKRRHEILGLQEEVEHEQSESYPLLTGRNKCGENITTVDIIPPDSHEYQIEFYGEEQCFNAAIDNAITGGCVLWICNTIKKAQDIYRELKNRAKNQEIEVGLLHSRYPFWQREKLENYWMEVLGKGEKHRKPCILISTQVVEQSVDLDADLLITELAPTDMLLQRMGRLWRHKRKQRPVSNAKLLVLSEEKSLEELKLLSGYEIKKILGSKAWVYSPFILLKSLEVWHKKRAVVLPTDIPGLLDETYNESGNEPNGWIELSDEWFGNEYAKKQIAARETNVFQKLLDDVEGASTRLNELPTIQLLLMESKSNSEWTLVDGSVISLESDIFNIETAKKINKNIVKIPQHYIIDDSDQIPENKVLKRYLSGVSLCGVCENNAVKIIGIECKNFLHYSVEFGLEVIKRNDK